MPTDFEWQDCYNVGNAVIDQQHKNMLRLCSQAARCQESAGPESREMFHDILHEMAVCARVHFVTEEELLLASNYPMLAEHVAEHEQFQVRLADFLFSAVEGDLDRTGVFHFLSEWWGSHVLESDMACRSYLAETDTSGLYLKADGLAFNATSGSD